MKHLWLLCIPTLLLTTQSSHATPTPTPAPTPTLAWGETGSDSFLSDISVLDSAGGDAEAITFAIREAIGQSFAEAGLESSGTTYGECSGFICAGGGPTPTPCPPVNPWLDLIVLLHGPYDAQDPNRSRGVSGDYAINIQLRDSFDGSGTNYTYTGIALDKNGTMAGGALPLGEIACGDYYLVASQLNHLSVITDTTITFDSDATVSVNLSDTASPDFTAVYGDNLYVESDGMLSMPAGNGEVATGQDLFINVLDAYIWLAADGSLPGMPNWDTRADYDANGLINVLDIVKWLHCNGIEGFARIE